MVKMVLNLENTLKTHTLDIKGQFSKMQPFFFFSVRLELIFPRKFRAWHFDFTVVPGALSSGFFFSSQAGVFYFLIELAN